LTAPPQSLVGCTRSGEARLPVGGSAGARPMVRRGTISSNVGAGKANWRGGTAQPPPRWITIL